MGGADLPPDRELDLEVQNFETWQSEDDAAFANDANVEPALAFTYPRRFREPGESRYNAATEELLEQRFRAHNRPGNWKVRMITRNLGSAYVAEFPAEAYVQCPLGRYALELAEVAKKIGIKEPDQPKQARDFASRTCFDSVVLKKIMMKMMSPAWPEIVRELPVNEQAQWIQRQQTLATCCQRKPDLRYLGFGRLTDADFKRKFEGNDVTFLQHMFEARYGEAINVSFCVKNEPVANPRLVAMHHSQFFVYAHKDALQQRACQEAKEYYGWKPEWKNRDRTEKFLDNQALCENSVFKPRDGGLMLPVKVAYHTLPSLVWECCGVANLLELYTYFVSQTMLMTKAPHSSGGAPSKKKRAWRQPAGRW